MRSGQGACVAEWPGDLGSAGVDWEADATTAAGRVQCSEEESKKQSLRLEASELMV